MRRFPIPDGPAKDLDSFYLTLRSEPLSTPEELTRFYRPELLKVRGEDTVAVLSRKLQESFGTIPFQAFVMGHPGVGKSTEIWRLTDRVKAQQVAVRISVADELNPSSFKVFDVLLLMLVSLVERAKELEALPFGGKVPADLVADIMNWVQPPQVKTTETLGGHVLGEVGAGVKEGSLWAKLLGILASVKGQIKYAAERKAETLEYSLQRLSTLVGLCNRLIDACSRALEEKSGKEWLLIVEDLDKKVISPQALRELFLDYGGVFSSLRVSIIFTIPVWLAYSPEAEKLPFDKNMIHDAPLFDRLHAPFEVGRSAVRSVLEARVEPGLFEKGQMTRLIVASGGNLRDLFTMVQEASYAAVLRNPPSKTIEAEDATKAINKMRWDYRMRLGQSPFDAEQIPYPIKAERLVAIYNGQLNRDVPDPAIYSLLRARAVQEFNGKGWYGVHPLVVDILKDQEHLPADAPGGTE